MSIQRKSKGQVFTPHYLVNMMLDFCGYKDDGILKKHVIDNSCGDGAFLVNIVQRYGQAFLAKNNNIEQLRIELETYIHGIELEDIAYYQCVKNLSVVAEQFGLHDVQFDIRHADALTIKDYDGQMDFVVGNPPYVRVHNLANQYTQVKSFQFAQEGMTDLYLVFYELGLRMLSPNGLLCYITPSSWLNSIAGGNMRTYIYENKNLISVVDLCHFQPFGATTYTMITLFDRQGRHNSIDYYTYDMAKNCPAFISTVEVQDMYINDGFYFSTMENLRWLRQILCTPVQRKAIVKNGYATLCDKVFIGKFPFHDFVIPVVKASTAEQAEALYPYDVNGKPFTKKEIFSHRELSEYLSKNKQRLLKQKNEQENPTWYLYGRTQGLLDTYQKKYAISSIIKDVKSIKLRSCPEGTGVYGGLYILTDIDECVLRKIIFSEKFILYLHLLKEYKSGGYYTINSKKLEAYINYQIYAYEYFHATT